MKNKTKKLKRKLKVQKHLHQKELQKNSNKIRLLKDEYNHLYDVLNDVRKASNKEIDQMNSELQKYYALLDNLRTNVNAVKPETRF